jgi:uncharacterized protein YndB with AHSA1/START domain
MSRPRHVFETYIKAEPERIWQALTDPAFTTRYLFGVGLHGAFETDTPYSGTDGDGHVTIDGVVSEAVPYRRLVMSFRLLFTPELAAEPASQVTWEITPVGDACRLTCIHGDLFKAPLTWQTTATGWSVVLAGLKTLLETGADLGEVPDDGGSPFAAAAGADVAWHRTMGIEANNGTYDLLDKTDRTADEDDALVHRAHAAAWHWGIAGTIVNRARAEYLVSRVHAFVGRPEGALHHANRCGALVTQAEAEGAAVADFDRAYAHEALARALACAGRLDEARAERDAAAAVAIADDEDRTIVEGDLATGPWYGLD